MLPARAAHLATAAPLLDGVDPPTVIVALAVSQHMELAIRVVRLQMEPVAPAITILLAKTLREAIAVQLADIVGAALRTVAQAVKVVAQVLELVHLAPVPAQELVPGLLSRFVFFHSSVTACSLIY